MSRQPRSISASEIGQFTFCRRAWWLARRQGSLPTNLDALARGEAQHRQHGRGVRFAWLGQAVARILLAAGVLTLLILALYMLLRGLL